MTLRALSYVFAAIAIATGIMDLVYRAFDTAEQPIQAWGDNVPGNHLFACVVGLALIVGGAALFDERTRRFGATVIAVVYAIFAAFWLPRLITAPAILGRFPGVYVGILAGVATQVIVICAACILYETRANADRAPRPVAWIFGICAILFGLQHLLNMHSPNNISMVPGWMPFGQVFWVLLTGSAFVLAGVAIILRVADVLAARLLGAMLLVFSAVTLLPILVAAPRSEPSWGSNLYNVIAAASAWILSDWLATAKGYIPASTYARSPVDGS